MRKEIRTFEIDFASAIGGVTLRAEGRSMVR